jgi:hypothetical protein
MNANDEEMMVTAVELMSNDKLYNLFEIVIREMNARKMNPKTQNEI